ncbi:MAG TPA: SLBB domain-containing protein [Candidatus Acidoferrum sp.]|nr:SLBB domain-containing protein [Candidatus Acidoferrum sp.]
MNGVRSTKFLGITTSLIVRVSLIPGVFLLTLAVGSALAQEQNTETPSSGEPQAASQSNSLRTRAGIGPSHDLMADNLGRVSATAEEILGVMSKDAGLMVEFKRVLAEDAGAQGQILDDADLTDESVTNRLRTDARSRVLATRLLQRFGYLLPKVNPDSDLAAEKRLVLQERASAIARAEKQSVEPQANPRTQQLTKCELQNNLDCSSGQRDFDRITHPLGNGGQPVPSDPDTNPYDRYPNSPSRGISTQSSPELRASLNSSYPGETLLTSTSQGGSGLPEVSPAPRTHETFSPEWRNPSFGVSSNSPGSDAMPDERRGIPLQASDTTLPRGEELSKAAEFEMGAGSLGPVAMVHQPSPYAAAPSLYDLYIQASPSSAQPKRFGLGVFQHPSLSTGSLPMDLPVGPDYVLGPGDGLSIELWGGVSERLFRTVDGEGRVALPEAGPLLVSGKSLGEVQVAVQRALRTQFRDVSADVSLLRLRTVRVYVVGEVASPGAYDISSLSTPLNALFAAGGVTLRGSLRNIEHYRGKQLIESVDAYDLLLHGIRGDLKRLENGDSLRVPPLGPTVTVEGMVRRPAVYELHGEKNLDDVLNLAGGILPAAALQHIEVQRMDAHDKRTMLSVDLGETTDKATLRAAFERFPVQDGDEIHIFPIAPYNSASVYLVGHVLRPGRYSYRPGMRLSDLIASYKDLLPEPAGRYAEIVRVTGPEKRPVVESFNLSAALAHPENSPALEPLDTVRIFGKYDLEAAPQILVTGEVRAAGTYKISGEEHVRDAIYQAGGISPEGWLDSAQLFREMPDGTTKVFSVSLRSALAGDPLNNLLIEPRDHIVVQRQPQRTNPASVNVRGEVVRPGRYPLASGMRVSDLVRAAGGLMRSANAANADLARYTSAVADSSAKAVNAAPASQDTVDLSAALRGSPGEDLLLRDGDVLTVPQQAHWNDVGATVSLRGEVARPGVYGIAPGERLSTLLSRAGGLLPTAYPQAAVFERVDVKTMQEQSRQDLIQRLEQESTVVKTSVSSSGAEEAALQQAAIEQRQRVIDGLRRASVTGRLVVHIRAGQRNFAGSPDDLELRAGDSLEIPKQPGFVLIVGQVYNSNAITYTPGKNTAWYLSRAGGATGLASKHAIFIIRASGSVTSGGAGLWTGGVLSSTIGPGDTIVVPERAVVGGTVWKNLVAIAQVAQAGALAAAVAIP